MMPELPLEDRVLIVRALVEKANAARAMARRPMYRGSGQYETSVRRTCRAMARDCDRVAKKLCETWGLQWRKEAQ